MLLTLGVATAGSPVRYPQLFWSQYTSLESQAQTPKLSKSLISGVSFRHHSLSQSHESKVLNYSEYKIAKIFHGFTSGSHRGRLTTPPPWLPSCKTFFLLATFIEKLAPIKNCWIQHWSSPILTSNWTAES